MPHPGWFDVAGGKLTTYRLMAEQTIDRIIDFANLKAASCATATTPLLPESERPFSGIVPPAVTREPVEHFCRNEWAIHLSDIMIRRTSWRYYHRDHLPIAQQVAAWMREMLDWSLDRMNEELASYEEDGCVTSLQAATQVQHA
jgi:glycerol-3-phosphate dehydrogenase